MAACYHLVISITEAVTTCASCGHDSVSRPIVCADCGVVLGQAVFGARLGTYTRSWTGPLDGEPGGEPDHDEVVPA